MLDRNDFCDSKKELEICDHTKCEQCCHEGCNCVTNADKAVIEHDTQEVILEIPKHKFCLGND